MNEPKLHHYVPQFYLERFTDQNGWVWAWDKTTGSSFPAKPGRLAAETQFYRLHEFEALGHDPLTMEKQFSAIESDIATITASWIDCLRGMRPFDVLSISDDERDTVALHLALQHLRTAEQRSILTAFAEEKVYKRTLPPDEQRALHTDLLWNTEMFRSLQGHIRGCSWVFARNPTGKPFQTSDNPVAFKSHDHRLWVKVGVKSQGVYLVHPLSPDLILYAHPPHGAMAAIKRFNGALSPVVLDEDMVEHENNGQVFNATRFVLSRERNFADADVFVRTIEERLNDEPTD